MNLLYKSTRDAEKTVTASQAILKGLADDGGLFVPVSIPKLPVSLGELKEMTYQEIAYTVMKEFLTDFTEEEYYQLHAQAWRNKKTWIQYETFHKDALYRIALYAKNQQVTVNSVLLTAFARASRELRTAVVVDAKGRQQEAGLKPDQIAMVLSLRGEYDGMGDYEYTYPIEYLYDDTLDFAQNVKKLHSRIHLDNSKEKYQQLGLLGELPGELVDSVQFQLNGRYVNPVTETIMKRLGMGEAPKGMAVTNLVKVPLASRYGSLRLYNYVFVPPVTANARRIIGVTKFQGVMNLSFHAMDDEFTPNSRLFYQKSIAYLREL